MKKIVNIITWIIILIILVLAFKFYNGNNFNEFVRSELQLNVSEFKRDNEVKYSNSDSYRIDSQEANDATFYKTIQVKKNTPYKVTCMVKTENVNPTDNLLGVGAQISLVGSSERSVAITGTQDWQKIEMTFNSQNNEEVDVGFRLGGYLGTCTGTAWFSDFTLEEGVKDDGTDWNFACFIFENTDVTVDGKEVKISMTDTEISEMEDIIKRFKSTIRTMSNNKMTANCDVFTIEDPVTRITRDEEFGYFVSAEDIEESIKDYVHEGDYDHIFVFIRLGDELHPNDIQVNDWIGLGSMDYYGVGFSNIRVPNESNSYIYRYDSRINTFPEEVLVHEFLHSLERTANEYGYDIPALHDYEKYGYTEQRRVGLKEWYEVYINQGLPEEIYTYKPAKASEFEYSYMIDDEFKEPSNVFEYIAQLFKNLVHNIQNIGKSYLNNDENIIIETVN